MLQQNHYLKCFVAVFNTWFCFIFGIRQLQRGMPRRPYQLNLKFLFLTSLIHFSHIVQKLRL